MSQKASGSGGWLRKALVRRVAEAVKAYEKEANRPENGAKKPAAQQAPDPAEPTGGKSEPPEADQA